MMNADHSQTIAILINKLDCRIAVAHTVATRTIDDSHGLPQRLRYLVAPFK
jgi:hypothetical protein